MITFASACVAGLVSAGICRWLHGRDLKRQEKEFLRFCRAEFMYWQESGDKPGAADSTRAVAIGATAASSNLIAATMGRPAPWHVDASGKAKGRS